jgi:hypothetical protein
MRKPISGALNPRSDSQTGQNGRNTPTAPK